MMNVYDLEISPGFRRKFLHAPIVDNRKIPAKQKNIQSSYRRVINISTNRESSSASFRGIQYHFPAPNLDLELRYIRNGTTEVTLEIDLNVMRSPQNPTLFCWNMCLNVHHSNWNQTFDFNRWSIGEYFTLISMHMEVYNG